MFFVHTINCSSSINILFRKKYQHYNQFLRHFQRDLLLHLRPNLLYFLLGFLVGFTTPSAFASSFEAALGPAVRYEEPTFFLFFFGTKSESVTIFVYQIYSLGLDLGVVTTLLAVLPTISFLLFGSIIQVHIKDDPLSN